MKITFEREKFHAAFQTAAAVAPARSPKPILQNVKLEVAADGATLMATDLEVGIRISVPGVMVETPGNAVLADRAVRPDFARMHRRKVVSGK